jgi:hypothetical protein
MATMVGIYILIKRLLLDMISLDLYFDEEIIYQQLLLGE